MRDRGDLPRLPLAAVERATQDIGVRVSNSLHRSPEIGCRCLIGDILQLPCQPALVDLVELLSSELEVVALHIYRPGLVADDVDAVVDIGDQLAGTRTVGRGLQRHVRHPLHRDVSRGVPECAPVRALEALLRRHLTVQLVSDQSAARDDVEPLLSNSLIVVADGGEAMVHKSISRHVHHITAVLQPAELIKGCEGGAGVRGLVAKCPIQLSCVSDRLMDREEQIAGMDHQVVQTCFDRWCGDVSRQQFGDLGHLGVEVPAGARQVLPTPAGRWSSGSHRRETILTDVDCGQLGLDSYPLLGSARAGEIRKVLVLMDVAEDRSSVRDTRRCEQRRVESQNSTSLGRFVDIERIHLVCRHPGDVSVDLFIGQLD